MQSGSGYSGRHQFGLFCARFCSAAWIGAATLFVIVGVSEVSGGFDSTTKDQLVALRFPAFYVCGTVLLGLGWLGTWLSGPSTLLPSRRRSIAMIAFAMILGLMAIDYVFIYLPLIGMVTPPGQVKPSGFANYHQASKYINLVELVFCVLIVVMTTWPVRQPAVEHDSDEPRKPSHD
jgi:hypothetical protein